MPRGEYKGGKKPTFWWSQEIADLRKDCKSSEEIQEKPKWSVKYPRIRLHQLQGGKEESKESNQKKQRNGMEELMRTGGS